MRFAATVCSTLVAGLGVMLLVSVGGASAATFERTMPSAGYAQLSVWAVAGETVVAREGNEGIEGNLVTLSRGSVTPLGIDLADVARPAGFASNGDRFKGVVLPGRRTTVARVTADGSTVVQFDLQFPDRLLEAVEDSAGGAWVLAPGTPGAMLAHVDAAGHPTWQITNFIGGVAMIGHRGDLFYSYTEFVDGTERGVVVRVQRDGVTTRTFVKGGGVILIPGSDTPDSVLVGVKRSPGAPLTVSRLSYSGALQPIRRLPFIAEPSMTQTGDGAIWGTAKTSANHSTWFVWRLRGQSLQVCDTGLYLGGAGQMTLASVASFGFIVSPIAQNQIWMDVSPDRSPASSVATITPTDGGCLTTWHARPKHSIRRPPGPA
jgi:hypothetical protein